MRLFRSAELTRIDPIPHSPSTVLVHSLLWDRSLRSAFVSYCPEPGAPHPVLAFACVLAWLTASIGEGTFAFAELWPVELDGFDGRSFDRRDLLPHVPVRRSSSAIIPASNILTRVVFLPRSTNARRGWVTPQSHQRSFSAPPSLFPAQ